MTDLTTARCVATAALLPLSGAALAVTVTWAVAHDPTAVEPTVTTATVATLPAGSADRSGTTARVAEARARIEVLQAALEQRTGDLTTDVPTGAAPPATVPAAAPAGDAPPGGAAAHEPPPPVDATTGAS